MTAVEQLMAGENAAMTFTDPPYNVNYRQRSKTTGPRRITNDDLGADFEPFLYNACVNILSVTDGAVYICMASAELHHLYTAFTRAGGHWSTFLIWVKDRFTLGRSDFQRAYEPILYGWPRGREHYWCGARNQGDVWQVPRPRSNKLHPTAKPIALIERAISNSSRAGDIVFDPFAGSGSTLIACQRTRRKARVIEARTSLYRRNYQAMGRIYGQNGSLRRPGQDVRRDGRHAVTEGGIAMRGKPFQPGNKFGRGRPPGSRNKVASALQQTLEEPDKRKRF